MPDGSHTPPFAAQAFRRRWWPRLRTALIVIFFLLVAGLLVIQARQVDWREVAGGIRGYGAGTLVAAAALASAGHLLYTTYELLARRYTGHRLRWSRVMSIAFVSYVINLNLGPLIGAMAFRFRLYSRFGIGRGTIARVLGFSIVSNWLGYLLLAGVLFSLRVVVLPADWDIGAAALQALGAVMIAVVAVYLWSCARARRRSLSMREFVVELPPLPLAALQVASSCASWMTMGAILFVLLGQQVAYPVVLGVLLLAAVAALLTHIPAGLGVLEATVVLLLGHRVPTAELLAAVLTYRAFYYLMPLVPALAVFLWLEARRYRP